MGDLFAQIASVNTGERKIHEMIARFGVDALTHGMQALMDYAEAQARAIVRAIPDGDYFFDEYADEDSAGGYPLRIALTVRVRGDCLVMDYTGTDPQVHSSLNIPTGGRERHVLATVGLVYVLYTLDPRLILNAGILRICRCILPEGTMLNPQHPAAVGMRSLTCLTLMQVTFGAFSLAVPERLAASPAGGLAIINVNTRTRDNRGVIASIGPVGGGAGGSATLDGTEGSGANTCFLRNTPVEIIESEVPIHMRRYGLVPDSGGPGRLRGGCGTLMEFQVFAPNTVVTARNRDRSRFAAWGIRGGDAGASSSFTRNPDTNTRKNSATPTSSPSIPATSCACTARAAAATAPPGTATPISCSATCAAASSPPPRPANATASPSTKAASTPRPPPRFAPASASSRTGTISPQVPAAPPTNSS